MSELLHTTIQFMVILMVYELLAENWTVDFLACDGHVGVRCAVRSGPAPASASRARLVHASLL